MKCNKILKCNVVFFLLNFHRLEKMLHSSLLADRVSQLPDELLYGRAGCLYALLYVKQFVGKKIDDHLITSVIKAILDSGIKLSDEYKKKGYNVPPLMFEWHGSKYLAAAHGMAGIFYLLFIVIEIFIFNFGHFPKLEFFVIEFCVTFI